MSHIAQFSLERARCQGPLSEWTDALSTRLGHLPLSSWDERLTTCRAVGDAPFAGRIEHGDVGDITLARVTTTTPHHLAMAQGHPSVLACPVVLLFQNGGSCRVEQTGRACTLYAGDWCMVDTGDPSRISALDPRTPWGGSPARRVLRHDPELLIVLAYSTGSGLRSSRTGAPVGMLAVLELLQRSRHVAEVTNPVRPGDRVGVSPLAPVESNFAERNCLTLQRW